MSWNLFVESTKTSFGLGKIQSDIDIVKRTISKTASSILSKPQERAHSNRYVAANESKGVEVDSGESGRDELHLRQANFQSLSFDQVLDILFFLEAEDACSFRKTSRFTEDVFQTAGETYWRHLCFKKFGVSALIESEQSKFYAQYLYLHHRHLEIEVMHVKSLMHCYEAMAKYFSCSLENFQPAVYGMLSDFVWTDCARLSAVLSKNRIFALPTIVVDSEQTIFEFKRLVHPIVVGPASFLPITVAMQGIEASTDNYDFNNEPQGVLGFLGYAVNLFRLRSEHEHFRYAILTLLFKNLMVFDTVASKLEYEMSLPAPARVQFRGVAMDEYTDEELARTYPRFAYRSPRPRYYRQYGNRESSNAATIGTTTTTITRTMGNDAAMSIKGGVLSSASAATSSPPSSSVSSPPSQPYSYSVSRVSSAAAGLAESLHMPTLSMGDLGLTMPTWGVTGSLPPSGWKESGIDMAAVVKELERKANATKGSYAVVRYSY